MLEDNSWWICAQHFKSISSKITEIWHKTCQKQALFTSDKRWRMFSKMFKMDMLLKMIIYAKVCMLIRYRNALEFFWHRFGLKYNTYFSINDHFQQHIHHFSRHFGTLPRFFEFYFLTDFDASKSVLGSFFAFFPKNWPKNMYCASKSRIFLLDLFLPGDLSWPWPLLWSQSTVNDTYKCQRHYPCRLVGFVCA